MRYTKQIEIINVFNENVTIKPINYSLALEIIELMEAAHEATDKVGKLFIKLYNEGVEDIPEHKEIKKLIEESNRLHEAEKEKRNKYNYYYCGLDNLDPQDKESLLKKYPRRITN